VSYQKNIFLAFSLALIFISQASSQPEGDRIIAVIGNEIILESELSSQILIFMQQNKVAQYNDRIAQQVFQNMLTEKLILAKADQDSIMVTQEETDQQVDFRIKNLVAQLGSEKNLEETYGMTMAKIRETLRAQIKRQIKIDKVKSNKFKTGVSVTRNEVSDFYITYKDSIPPVPETYELYEITRTPELTQESKNIAYRRISALLDSVKGGMDFSDAAKKYSEDSASAVLGGDLGKAKKGNFVKEFEDAAFVMSPGDVSGIIETKFGYHIIKLNEKSGDWIRTQHILIRFPKLESADFECINFLKDVKQKFLSSEGTFQQLAIKYSQDATVSSDSGYVGKVTVSEMDSLEIYGLRNSFAGDVTDPIRVFDERTDYSYKIYFVRQRFPEHYAALKEDFAVLEKMALSYKENKILNEWLEELKKTIYVDIKI